MDTASLRQVKTVCEIGLIAALLLCGLETARIWYELTRPLPAGVIRFDLNYEISAVALILNAGLPAAVVALTISTAIKVRMKTFEPLSAGISIAGVVGVFACTLAIYSGFVAMTPGMPLLVSNLVEIWIVIAFDRNYFLRNHLIKFSKIGLTPG